MLGAMRRLRNHLIGLDNGELTLFSDFENGGPMWAGTDPRLSRTSIVFSGSFKTPPMVQVALSMWDMDSGPNARMEITAENVSATGFDVVFRTWGDTRVARARATWMAMGELRDSDEWDLY